MSRKVIKGWITAIVMACLLIIPAAPAAAVDYGDYTGAGGWHWSESYGGWIDDSCSSSNPYQVALFKHAIGTSNNPKIKVCSWVPDLTNVPMSLASVQQVGSCGLLNCIKINGVWWLNASDTISGIRVILNDETSSCARRLRLYNRDDYEPTNLTANDSTWDDFSARAEGDYGIPSHKNDTATSFRSVCP